MCLKSFTVTALSTDTALLYVLLHGLPEISHCYSTVCLKSFTVTALSADTDHCYCMDCLKCYLLLLGMQKFLMSLYGVLKCITVTAWTAGNVSLLMHGLLKFITVSVSMECKIYHCYCRECWKCITVTAWNAEMYHCYSLECRNLSLLLLGIQKFITVAAWNAAVFRFRFFIHQVLQQGKCLESSKHTNISKQQH